MFGLLTLLGQERLPGCGSVFIDNMEFVVVRPDGFEPSTHGLEGRRYSQKSKLSYCFLVRTKFGYAKVTLF